MAPLTLTRRFILALTALLVVAAPVAAIACTGQRHEL